MSTPTLVEYPKTKQFLAGEQLPMEAAVTKADQSQELLATVTGIGRLISFRGGTRSAPALQPAGETVVANDGGRYEKASDYGAFMRDLHRMIRKDRDGQLRVQLQKYKLVRLSDVPRRPRPGLALNPCRTRRLRYRCRRI